MTTLTLQGKTALITGASRGIGAAIYKALGECGATVVGTATTEQGAQNITAAAQGFNGKGVVYNAADANAAKTLAEVSADIVVCNAAVTADKLLMRMKDEDWHAVMQTNLTGAFHLARAVIPAMIKKRWGRLIGISSVVAGAGNPGQANYCASKAGMEGMFRAIAREAAPRGVTVNTIAPGFVNTDMTASLPEQLREQWIKTIPLGRMASPEEIASAVLFLSTPAASYITGQTLHINGGLTMN